MEHYLYVLSVRKDINSLDPSTYSVPPLGFGTTSSQHVKVRWFHIKIYCNISTCSPNGQVWPANITWDMCCSCNLCSHQPSLRMALWNVATPWLESLPSSHPATSPVQRASRLQGQPRLNALPRDDGHSRSQFVKVSLRVSFSKNSSLQMGALKMKPAAYTNYNNQIWWATIILCFWDGI